MGVEHSRKKVVEYHSQDDTLSLNSQLLGFFDAKDYCQLTRGFRISVCNLYRVLLGWKTVIIQCPYLTDTDLTTDRSGRAVNLPGPVGSVGSTVDLDDRFCRRRATSFGFEILLAWGL